MSKKKGQAEQRYNQSYIKKKDIDDIPRSMQQYLQFMEYKIRRQVKTFTILSICGTDRGHFVVDKNFQRAFATLSFQEKVDYYGVYVDHIERAIALFKNIEENYVKEFIDNDKISLRLKVGKESKAFEETEVTIQNNLVVSQNKGIPQINLSNYLLRKSKKKTEFCYALQAIRPSDINTIRFAFISRSDQQKYLPLIRKCINDSSFAIIQRQIFQIFTKRRNYPNQLQVRQVKLQTHLEDRRNKPLELDYNALRNSRMSKSVIEDIVKARDDQQLDQQLTQLINDQNQQLQRTQKEQPNKPASWSISSSPSTTQKNIFRIIFPTHNIHQLQKLHHYGSIYHSNITNMNIYINALDPSQLKMQLVIHLPLEIIVKAIYNVQMYKYWHPDINQGQVKVKISSENSCIAYCKMRAYSEWYRERDFLFLLHVFHMDGAFFVVGKSVQNASFIPFQSITRANMLYYIWRIEPVGTKQDPKCKVYMQFKAQHEGHLNKCQQKNLSSKFLTGFERMQAFYKKPENQNKLSQMMGLHWKISMDYQYEPQPQNQNMALSVRTCDFQDASEISEEEDDIFYSIVDLSEEEEEEEEMHQIKPEVLEANKEMMMQSLVLDSGKEEVINTNPEGLVILPKTYLKKKFAMVPNNDTKRVPIKLPFNSILERDDWIIEKNGGMKLVNQTKIEAQNNVLKFVMKSLKKNLFSGKFSISLPVEIFLDVSHLQRTCYSYSLAPQFLEHVAKSNDYLERFKKVMAFGMSNSVLYFNVEKPFNPILGETYQGFIRGCPIYAEQICHHPPITSLLFMGRGYKITSTTQAKVNIHMNSADGINEGLNHVIFDDGHQIVFQTPPAQLSGLAMGERRFAWKNQGLFADLKNMFFSQTKFEGGGGFFGKKRQFTDQIQGSIVKVKSDFIKRFMEAELGKKPSPTQGDIVQKLAQLSGRWPYIFKINDIPYYDIIKDLPDQMMDEPYPLNSNSKYREDLHYRKHHDLSRSQIEKQRLQVIQRKDRKLREQFHGPSH